jgi:hypothetical protein
VSPRPTHTHSDEEVKKYVGWRCFFWVYKHHTAKRYRGTPLVHILHHASLSAKILYQLVMDGLWRTLVGGDDNAVEANGGYLFVNARGSRFSASAYSKYVTTTVKASTGKQINPTLLRKVRARVCVLSHPLSCLLLSDVPHVRGRFTAPPKCARSRRLVRPFSGSCARVV